MGVSVQREACGEVAQHAGDRLDVHVVLKRQRCEGVAKIVEAHGGETCAFQNPVGICLTLSGEIGPPLGDGNTYSQVLCFSISFSISTASLKIETLKMAGEVDKTLPAKTV